MEKMRKVREWGIRIALWNSALGYRRRRRKNKSVPEVPRGTLVGVERRFIASHDLQRTTATNTDVVDTIHTSGLCRTAVVDHNGDFTVWNIIIAPVRIVAIISDPTNPVYSFLRPRMHACEHTDKDE
jgi:hypothetical protein